MTILIDLDEVINDMTHHWINVLNSVYGYNVLFEDITNWNIQKFYPLLTKNQIYEPLNRKIFWNGVQLLPKAKEGINSLVSAGHNVYIVSASHPNTIAIKYEWLNEHLPIIGWEQIIITQHKELLKGDIIIDGGLHNLTGNQPTKILLDKPWNRVLPNKLTNNIKRVYNWMDITNTINTIHNKTGSELK